MPPLGAVNRAQIAVFLCPLVPDMHSVLIEIPDVRISLQEPKQLVDHSLEKKPLCGGCRESVGEVKAHLPAKDAQDAGSRSVRFLHAVLQDFPEEVQILLHWILPYLSRNDAAPAE
jgi:hypothetical protein